MKKASSQLTERQQVNKHTTSRFSEDSHLLGITTKAMNVLPHPFQGSGKTSFVEFAFEPRNKFCLLDQIQQGEITGEITIPSAEETQRTQSIVDSYKHHIS